MLAAICLVAVMGFLLHSGVFDRTPRGQISAETLTAGESLTFTGQVYQKDSENLYFQTVHIISSAGISQPAIPCKDNFICIPEQGTDVPLGSVMTVTGTFQPFSQATNPGEFDSLEYYRTLGIGGRVKNAVPLAQGESFWRLREGLYRLRVLLKGRLENVLPEKEAAVMCALMLGDKEDLDPGLKELYQRNGILHILSISSLHITMIGMTVYRLLRRCRIPVCPAALAGCALLFLYGMMTGFSVSACRAIGMYLLRMTAEILGRTYDMPTAMGVTAAVLVVKNPYYLRHTGFLLSFASMLGIGAVYPAMGYDGGKKSVRQRMMEPVLSGVSITLATLPVQLWFYYQTPSYSVLLNILVLPFMKVLMAAGFLALIPGLGFCGWAARLILQGYETLCGLFDSFPFHTWNPGKPRLWQVIAYYLVLAAAVWGRRRLRDRKRELQGNPGRHSGEWPERKMERPMEKLAENLTERLTGKPTESPHPCPGWPGRGHLKRIKDGIAACSRKWQYQAGIAACLMALLLDPVIFAWRPPAKNRLLFLDVGQGDGILVSTISGEHYLFDGGSNSRTQVGKYVLLPCLRYYGIQKLDAVILSHPDADHVNGALELLAMKGESGIRIRQMVLPELSEKGQEDMLGRLGQFMEEEDWDDGIPVGYLSAGEGFRCGGAEFVCLHPQSGWKGMEPNAYSICIYGIFTGRKGEREFDFLMTGDVEGGGEEALLTELSRRGIQGISILKVAHHGSGNSTSVKLLEQAAPALSVISCGRSNRYGHPHQELLERLEDTGCTTITTSETGAVSVTSEQGMLRVETFR